jgi:small subunit ribosomal protein S12
MLTKSQIILRNKRKKLKIKNTTQPFFKSVVSSAFILTPRKPNSAKRKIVRVMLKNKPKTAYVPGCGHTLIKHSVVLVRGGNVKDLPGVKNRLVRGKYDLRVESNRKSRRSKYGISKTN